MAFFNPAKQKSIYDRIAAARTAEGTLREGFQLPGTSLSEELQWAPGALDGVIVYHSANENASYEDTAIIVKLLANACKNGDRSELEKFMKNRRAVSFVDPVIERITEGKSNIVPGQLFNLASAIVQRSSDIETVKLGIGLLGIFNIEQNKELREVLFTLGLYDEFTLFAVVTIHGWPDGNALIFQIAQNCHGWGKIHAVDRLHPQSEEIKTWLLESGCHNDVMDSYLALTCAENGDLCGALRQQEINQRLFHGAGVILSALLEDSPMPGLSEYADGYEALTNYLHHADKHCTALADLDVIFTIKLFLGNAPENQNALAQCDKIIHKPGWTDQIKAALDTDQKGLAVSLAEMLNINVMEEALHAMEKDCLSCGGIVDYVFQSLNSAQRAAAIYEKNVPLTRLMIGPARSMGIGNDAQAYQCFNSVLQGLEKYPNLGSSLICMAMYSPVISNRNTALRTIRAWEIESGKSIDSLAPEIYETIKKVLPLEPEEDIQMEIQKFL